MSVDEVAAQARQIEQLRAVVSSLQIQVAALQALNAETTGDARAEATAIIDAWGPRFRAVLDWEFEFDADAQIAIEAWEQLVLQMCTARAVHQQGEVTA